MKLVVLVKQVPDVSQMEFDPETRTLRRDGVRLEVSSFDIRALVAALELREAHGGEVLVVTMGPPQARDALVHCMALGADRGIHLVDRAFAGSDTLATARALAAALRNEGFDLILCGQSSVDAETGQVGPEVAELLGIAQITFAGSVETDGDSLRAERESEDFFVRVECPLPALVSVTESAAPEKFPRRKEKEAAREKPIQELSARDLADDTSGFGLDGSPTRVESIEKVEEHREGRILEGGLPGVAEELVRLLRERGALGDGLREGPGKQSAPEQIRTHGEGEIWVVAELEGEWIRPVTFELLGKASALADRKELQVVAMALGRHAEEAAFQLGEHGADRVLLADDPALEPYSTEVSAHVLAEAIRGRQPRAVLLPATVRGRDLAPRVAARLGLGLTGDCIDLSFDDEGRLLQWKPAFGGNFVAPILSRTRPDMATVRPGMLEILTPRVGRRPDVERLDVGRLPDSRVRQIGRRPLEGAAAAADLDDAEIVVGVGKGLGGPEHLDQIRSLAEQLGGAAIAATREVTDLGWLPKQLQVGLTGRAIAPRLYIAVGIRGMFEHLVGLRRAGTIVAINDKEKSAIFKNADLGIVADWREAVPALQEALRKGN